MNLRLLLLAAAAALPARGADLPPANLGKGLRELVAWHQAQPANDPPASRQARLAAQFAAVAQSVVRDTAVERVIVNVKLDGALPPAAVRAHLEALGATVSATHQIAGPGSVITARLPLTRVVDASVAPGVFAVNLVHRPVRRVGKATSQGVGALRSEAVNALGYDGRGITVGVLSDSFDRVTPHAAADVLAGDLPGAGNPSGQAQPVYILAEGGANNTDEGRAMLQIIHDVAPGARLAFAGVGDSQETFAARLRALRTDPNAGCDIITDDISFPDEPFFYDGPVAQAVDDVVNSDILNGRKVLFYSAAGNDGGAGWADDFRPVSDADARAGLGAGNLRLAAVPVELTGGGFQNFDPRPGKTAIAQKVTLSGGPATVTLQWDDPAIPGLITTDYNVLVFDVAGNYLRNIDGGIDVNVPTASNPKSTGEPLEIFDLDLARDGGDTVYQLAITRRNAGSQQATHLRYVATSETVFEAEFAGYETPTIYGHPAARGADAVAAYAYNALGRPESFTSLGPVTIYFDRDGARLRTPERRQQPTMAAPDNVNTSFFPAGNDTDDDGLPNFLGTSAAAPHAAGVAALLLQAAGGPGKLTAAQARALLQGTARAHDLDPSFAQATATTGDGATATLQAVGDASNRSSADPHFFRLTFNGENGGLLRRATIDLGASGLKFDPSVNNGLPLTFGKGRGLKAKIGVTFASDDTALTLKFPKGALPPELTIEFGVDRDDIEKGMEGNSADVLAGATLSIKTKDASGAVGNGAGTFGNAVGRGYTPVDGFGLIDAEAAVEKLLAEGPPGEPGPP